MNYNLTLASAASGNRTNTDTNQIQEQDSEATLHETLSGGIKQKHEGDFVLNYIVSMSFYEKNVSLCRKIKI